MKSPPFTTALMLVLLFLAAPWAWTQDTRGGLLADAKLLLADGTSVEADDVRQGAVLWAWLPEGKAGTVQVTATRRQHADSFIRLLMGKTEFRATGSHRVVLAGGRPVRLDTVKVGDRVLLPGPKGLVEAGVTEVRLYPANLVTYDLTVAGHLPFVVDGVLAAD